MHSPVPSHNLFFGAYPPLYLPRAHTREKRTQYHKYYQDMLIRKYFIGWIFYQYINKLSQSYSREENLKQPYYI